MTPVQAIVLGLVQGLTEFLPISSSGHLVLLSKLPWWIEQPLVFDTTLHLATALSLVIYFYKDLFQILTSFIHDLKAKTGFTSDSKLLFNMIVGSIPAGILGFLFEDAFETKFRSLVSVAVFMLLGSLLIWFAQKHTKETQNLHDISLKNSFTIGMFQALALFPGVSRSGATLSGALIHNLPRQDAAKFSFLLSIPIVLMAGLYKLVSTDWVNSNVAIGVLILGFITSLFSGLVVVHFFLNYLRKKNLNIFIWYRIILSIGLLIFFT